MEEKDVKSVDIILNGSSVLPVALPKESKNILTPIRSTLLCQLTLSSSSSMFVFKIYTKLDTHVQSLIQTCLFPVTRIVKKLMGYISS